MKKSAASGISVWEAIGIAWDFLAVVLVLTASFATAGVLADRFFHTKALFTAISFALLILAGRPLLLRKANAVVARLEGRNADPRT